MDPDSAALFAVAADAILALHALFVAFVVLGLALILAGKLLNWRWIRKRWLRFMHLAAIGMVVAQAWLGANCPLTILEMMLRARAGEAAYAGQFIAHWLSRLLYYDAPAWAFTVAYSVFGAIVVFAWFWVPPDRRASPVQRNGSKAI